MHPITYDVAVSLDGYISGPSGDISKFAHDGPVVDDYMDRLSGYATAIMGRASYEFGYAFGLQPGQNPYPHMRTFVVSDTLALPGDSAVSLLKSRDAEAIEDLKWASDGPIYLCGGGVFAGWLLEAGLIDRMLLKRAPCVYGGGVRLFGDAMADKPLTRVRTKTYENGYLLEELTPRANPEGS